MLSKLNFFFITDLKSLNIGFITETVEILAAV